MSHDSTARRIALAWRELRRGAAETTLRVHLLGPDGPSLEQAQLDALEILGSEPDGMRMSDFADAMRVDPSTATRAVGRLEKVGLATRRTGTSDARVTIAGATPKGKQLIDRATRRRAVGMERLLEPFDDDERERFAEFLERFVGSIDDLVAELTRDDASAR